MRERIELRIDKGMLIPASERAVSILRERGYRIGDIVLADIRKERNPRFHALAHALGSLCAQNIAAFSGLDAHAVLKRLQLESGIECTEQVAELPDGTQYLVRQPKSMAFERMDEAQFGKLVSGLCSWIAARHWPTLTPEQIENMAGAMVD